MNTVLETKTSYGTLYEGILTWKQALSHIKDTLDLPVSRVSVHIWEEYNHLEGITRTFESPVIYFEDQNGSEIGCFSTGLNLQIFLNPRLVHDTMRPNKVLWENNDG